MVKKARGILLLGIMVSVGCKTAHDVAVTSFRVIDAPANYVRQHIDGPKSTPAPAQIVSDSVRPGRTLSSSPPPHQSTARVVPPSQPQPNATPRPSRVTTTESSRPAPTTAPRNVTTPPGQFPTAKPVPGKTGYVYSPFDTNGGYVDVNGFPPGSKVKDPYSGKIFLVP